MTDEITTLQESLQNLILDAFEVGGQRNQEGPANREVKQKYAEKLVAKYPCFESYYLCAWYFNYWNEHSHCHKYINLLTEFVNNKTNDNKTNDNNNNNNEEKIDKCKLVTYQRSIYLLKGASAHTQGFVESSKEYFDTAISFNKQCNEMINKNENKNENKNDDRNENILFVYSSDMPLIKWLDRHLYRECNDNIKEYNLLPENSVGIGLFMISLANENSIISEIISNFIKLILSDKTDDKLIKLLDSNKILTNELIIKNNIYLQMDILLFLLRIRPNSNIITYYLSNIILNNNNRNNDELVGRLLLTNYNLNYNMIIYDFAKIKLIVSNIHKNNYFDQKWKSQFGQLFIIRDTILENAISNIKTNMIEEIPKLIIRIIIDYIDSIELNIINHKFTNNNNKLQENKNNEIREIPISRDDDNYYCQILEYWLTPCMIMLSFDERGDMSRGLIQHAKASKIIIHANFNNENNNNKADNKTDNKTDDKTRMKTLKKLIKCESIFYEINNAQKQLKGKMCFYLSRDNINSLKQCENFQIGFRYGYSNYKEAIIFDSNKTMQSVLDSFLFVQ